MAAMSAAAVPAAVAEGDGRWRRIGVRGVRTVGAGFVVAVCIWAMSPRKEFGITLVYSLCIALSCWLLIDLGRELVASRLSLLRFGESTRGTRWPGWPWMLLIVLAGGVLGYALGNELANRLTGIDLPGPFTASWRQLMSLLVFSLVPAVTITYFFQSREVIAEQQAQVERAERQAGEERLKLLESQLVRDLLPRLDATKFWQVHGGLVVRADAIETAVRDEAGKVALRLRARPETLTVSRLHASRFRAM